MRTTAIDRGRYSATLVTKAFLMGGPLSSAIYIVLNIVVPTLWSDYNWITQTVSELSAIGAPTRSIWFPFGVIYAITFGLFGYGILRNAHGSKNIVTIGVLVIIYSCLSLYWPPMHLRGAETTISDTLHIVWTTITVLLMVLIMSLAAVTFERIFKMYTIISVLALLIFGILTAQQAPDVPRNLPTPTIGIWERLNIGVFMVWVVVLALVSLKREHRYSMSSDRYPNNMYASTAFKTEMNH